MLTLFSWDLGNSLRCHLNRLASDRFVCRIPIRGANEFYCRVFCVDVYQVILKARRYFLLGIVEPGLTKLFLGSVLFRFVDVVIIAHAFANATLGVPNRDAQLADVRFCGASGCHGHIALGGNDNALRYTSIWEYLFDFWQVVFKRLVILPALAGLTRLLLAIVVHRDVQLAAITQRIVSLLYYLGSSILLLDDVQHVCNSHRVNRIVFVPVLYLLVMLFVPVESVVNLGLDTILSELLDT